jgi:hypothetical protein
MLPAFSRTQVSAKLLQGSITRTPILCQTNKLPKEMRWPPERPARVNRAPSPSGDKKYIFNI